LNNQISELASGLLSEIINEIKNPESSESLCRAVYLAICLDLNTDLAEKHPIPWNEAVQTFETCWKLKQLIFHGGDFPSILRMKEKFLHAGISKPQEKIALPVIWLDNRICLSPDQVKDLNTEDYDNPD
jgi:hypothetical protein